MTAINYDITYPIEKLNYSGNYCYINTAIQCLISLELHKCFNIPIINLEYVNHNKYFEIMYVGYLKNDLIYANIYRNKENITNFIKSIYNYKNNNLNIFTKTQSDNLNTLFTFIDVTKKNYPSKMGDAVEFYQSMIDHIYYSLYEHHHILYSNKDEIQYYENRKNFNILDIILYCKYTITVKCAQTKKDIPHYYNIYNFPIDTDKFDKMCENNNVTEIFTCVLKDEFNLQICECNNTEHNLDVNEKKCTILNYPKYLSFQIKKNINNTSTKNEYLKNRTIIINDNIYMIKCIMYNRINSHFWCVIRNQHTYYFCDDNNIKKISFQEVLKDNICYIIYEKIF